MRNWIPRKITDCIESPFAGEWGDLPTSTDSCRVIRATELDTFGGADFSGGARRSFSASVVERKRLRPGDIIIEASGGSPDIPVGRVALVPSIAGGERILCSNFMRVLRPRTGIHAPFFHRLLFWLWLSPAISKYQQQTTGIINLKLADYLQYEVFLPDDKEEQGRIATILDASEAAIRASAAVIDKLRKTNEGAISSAIHRATEASVQISALGEIVTGSTPSPVESRNWGGVVPFITPGEIGSDGVITTSDRKLTRRGCLQARIIPAASVLIVCIGSTYGKVGVCSTECATNQQINALIPSNDNHPLVIAAMIRYAFPQMRALAGLQAVPIINKSQFGTLRVPSLNASQHLKIGHLIESCDSIIAAEESKVAKLRLQHQGLLHDLLTGRVRTTATMGSVA